MCAVRPFRCITKRSAKKNERSGIVSAVYFVNAISIWLRLSYFKTISQKKKEKKKETSYSF